MFPKPNFKRRKPKQKQRNNFTYHMRKEVMEHYDGQCQVCYAKAVEIHHVKFKSQGGRNVFTNALPLCQPCHISVHTDFDLAERLRNEMADKFGEDYYKDEWD